MLHGGEKVMFPGRFLDRRKLAGRRGDRQIYTQIGQLKERYVIR